MFSLFIVPDSIKGLCCLDVCILRWLLDRDTSVFSHLVSTIVTPACGLVFLAGFVRVLEILESPGILLSHFPGLESPGKVMLVLESPGNLLN